MTAVYVDSSALVKLVVPEAESAALESALRPHDEWISSIVCVTEVMRATHRLAANAGLPARTAKARAARAENLLRCVGLMDLDLASAFRAGAAPPVDLRSLDAIHLGTAIELKDDLAAFATYDARLAVAARAAGLRVISPS